MNKEEAMTYIPNPERISIIGAWAGLTARFGMELGVTLPLKSPLLWIKGEKCSSREE